MRRLFWIVQTCLGITVVLNEEGEGIREGARMMEATSGCCALRMRPLSTAREQEDPAEAGKARIRLFCQSPQIRSVSLTP